MPSHKKSSTGKKRTLNKGMRAWLLASAEFRKEKGGGYVPLPRKGTPEHTKIMKRKEEIEKNM